MKLFEVTQKSLDGTPKEGQIRLVSRNPIELRNITNPSKDVQIAAINTNWYAIMYIDNPSDEMLRLAISRNSYAITVIKDPSEELQIMAIQQDPSVLYNIVVEGDFKGTLSDTAITIALTHPALKYNQAWAYDEYPEVIKKLFKNNALLYNKWMRYWEKNKGIEAKI